MVDSGLHGQRGQEIGGEQHVTLGSNLDIGRQQCCGMGRRSGSLSPLRRDDQIRLVRGSHPPDEPGVPGITFAPGRNGTQ
jgi:hypothetical protein